MNTDVKTVPQINVCTIELMKVINRTLHIRHVCYQPFFLIKTLKPLADRVVLLDRVNYILLNLKNKSKCSGNDSDM